MTSSAQIERSGMLSVEQTLAVLPATLVTHYNRREWFAGLRRRADQPLRVRARAVFDGDARTLE